MTQYYIRNMNCNFLLGELAPASVKVHVILSVIFTLNFNGKI